MKENSMRQKLLVIFAWKERPRIEIIECFAHVEGWYKMLLHVVVILDAYYIVGGKITKYFCDEEK